MTFISQRFSQWLHRHTQRRAPALLRLDWLSILAVAGMLLLGSLYWTHLLRQQHEQIQFAQEQTRLRASQIAKAMSAQVGTLVGGLEYLAQSLATHYDADPQGAFLRAVATAMDTFPEGALRQIAVADAQGKIVFTNLDSSLMSSPEPVSIADREHFKVHVLRHVPDLYISKPVLGRVSGKWSVQFSYGIQHQGTFAGVVVLSVAPEYLSRQFREVFTSGRDVALLVNNEGAYLARSHALDDVMNRAVPPQREFLQNLTLQKGEYRTDAPIDGVNRFYAWERLSGQPLVVSVGLDSDRALQATMSTIREMRLRNAAALVVLLAGGMWITLLFRQQRRDRDQLFNQKQRYQMALDGGRLGTWDWTLSEPQLYCDTRWRQLLGMEPSNADPTLHTLEAATHPHDWLVMRDTLRKHLRGTTDAFEVEARMRHTDGSWRWISIRGRVISRQEDGRALSITGTYLDVTERHELEQERQQWRDRLTKLLAQVPGTVYQYRANPDGSSHFPYASPGIFDIYGLTPERAALDAEHAFESIHEQDREYVRQSILTSAHQLAPWHCEWRQVRPDGEVRWLSGSANPEREMDGGILWHGYIHDVTEQHQTLEALRNSEQRLRLTVAAVRDGLWEWNTIDESIAFDARCAEMLDYAPEHNSVKVQDWLRLLHPDERQHVLTLLQRQVALQSPFSLPIRALSATGQWRWLELRGQAAGHHVVGTLTDISQRMADARLQRALLDNAAAALLITGPDRIIRLANQRAVETFSDNGLPLEGRSSELLHRDANSYSLFQQHIATARLTGSVNVEHLLRTASGALRWFSMRGTPLDADHPESELIWTLVDTTERRHAEEALATAQAHLTEVIQHFPGGVLVQDESGAAVVVNQTLCDMFGIPLSYASVIGRNREELLTMIPPQVKAQLPSRENPPQGDLSQYIYEVSTPDQRTIRVDLILLHTTRGDAIGRLWLTQDITERRRREQSLQRMASTDALTGLANRRAFMTRMETELEHVMHGDPPGMLMMLDLDHFKRVNDTWGHAIGDAVLVHLAKLLQGNLLRREDMPARLGGEEFAVLLPATSSENAMRIAQRLRLALEQSRIPNGSGGTLLITMSVGLAPLQGNANAVLGTADAALYDAKHGGRNQVVLRTDTWAAPE